MPMTPSKSNCSRSGHKLAMASKSRSVRPRIAAKNSFLIFGQLFKSCFKLSPGDGSSRKLFRGNVFEYISIPIIPERVFDFTYHQPNSTSCNSVHVVASASNPIDDKLRDFHISIDCICLLYCDIVIAVSSMFAWLKAKLRCFKFVLFFNSNKICSSGISTWNKSNRSKLQIRANGFPVVCRNERSDRFLNDNSAKFSYCQWIYTSNVIGKGRMHTFQIATNQAHSFYTVNS